MSRFKNLIFLTMAVVLAFSLAVPVLATDVGGESRGNRAELREQFRKNAQANTTATNIALHPASQGARRAGALNPPGELPTVNASAPCAISSTQCPGFEELNLFNTPSGAGAGSRKAVATQVVNPGLLPESVKTVSVLVLWDPLDELGIGYFPTPGTPSVRVEVYADAAGLPSGPALASVTRVFADWTTDPGMGTFGGATLVGYLDFDVSGAGLVIPIGSLVHVAAWIDQTTPGVDWLWLWSDDASVGGCPDVSSNYRTSGFPGTPRWVSTTENYGVAFNFTLYTELCSEQPPPVCFTQHNWCDAAAGVTIFGMPRTTRNAFANRYFAGQAGQAQACTVKAIYPWFYENSVADGSADIVVEIREDDGAGLPGALLWDDSLVYGTFVMDLSGPTTVLVPDVVVTGEYYVSYRAVNPIPAALATRITFVGSTLGAPEAVCDPYTADAMFVLLPDNVTWQDENTFFASVAGSELWVDVDICCPELEFAACTPSADTEWETQGNGFARTNATSSSLSSLCGVTLDWSAKPGGTCNMIQPIIAGGKVLTSGVDSLHCYDKATGVQSWAFGGFPYIIGDLRGSPTVAGGAVYVGGAGAQAFSKLDLATGAPLWSRNLGGLDVPLSPGQTNYTPNVVSGGNVYFTQETGRVYKVSDATGADAGGSPLLLPDQPGAVPYNALTSDGVKLWVGTANTLGTGGNLHQIDMATMTIDWTLTNPGMIFYPLNTDPYDPEGFPGSLAYEDGILYYHSQVRNDANGNAHFPQSGSVGAIDVALEDGSGAGILWVNDAASIVVASPGTVVGTFNWSGPAVGPGMIYLSSRGFFGGTTEQDGLSAWDKTLGVRVWYTGYSSLGVTGGVTQLNDIRSDVPVTVFCQGGFPYLFTSHLSTAPNAPGVWRLVDGNSGDLIWYRTFNERVRGTAVADDCVAMHVRTNSPGGGGMLCVFNVGADRPRLQIDSQFVFRTASPLDGAVADNILDALSNSGCIDLNVAAYTEINPPVVRVLGVDPILASSSERSATRLMGFDALLNASNLPKLRAIAITGGIDEGEEEAGTARMFARNSAKAAADPLFLTVTEAPGAIAPGATQSIAVIYDETGLTNNTGYTNFIEIDSDDPDYNPQDPTDDPAIQFELFIGCPDAQDQMNIGLGTAWINNFGAEAGGGSFIAPDHMVVNGEGTHHFDGGWALVVQDSLHWAFDGCSVGGYPRRAGEWGPTLPCGLSVVANNYPSADGPDAVEEATYNMIDLVSANLVHPAAPSSRGAGGVFLEVQRVGSQNPAFGDFVLTRINLTNEAGTPGDIVGALKNVYFGMVTDWDISSNDNVRNYNDGYAQEDNGAGAPGTGSWMSGHVRLDGNHVGAGGIGSGGSPTFMASDIQDDQGHGAAALRMLSNPTGYCATVDPASCANTDLAALWSAVRYDSIADGASVEFFMAIYRVEDGTNGLPFVAGAAGAEAVYREVTCRAKAFAGFGKGDINCDGCVDLQDVVALGNIVDGLLDPTGSAAVYTGDTDGDNDWDNADYDLLYDVVSGVQLPGALANGWRF